MRVPYIDDLPATSDGLRAWLVTLGVFLALFVCMGMLYAVGILVNPLMEEFHSTYAATQLVGTLQLTGYFVGGIVAGPLADRYGIRTIGFVGSVMWLIGMGSSAAVTALWQLYITLGLLVGVGASFVIWPAVAIVPMWFEKWRGTASSIGLVGEGVGNVIMAYCGTELFRVVGWRNALLVLGAIGLAILPIYLVLIDRRFPMSAASKKEGFFTYSLLLFRTDPAYRWFFAGCLTFNFSFFIPINIVASWAVNDLGYSVQFAGLAVSMMGIGTCVGRLLLGPMGDKLGNYNVFYACMFLTGVVMMTWVASGSSQAGVLCFCFFVMAIAGGFVAQFPVIAANQWGVERLASAFPLLSVSMIPGALAAGPLAGYVRDTTGSYLVIQYVSAAIMFFVTFCFFMVKEKPARPFPGQPGYVPEGGEPAATDKATEAKVEDVEAGAAAAAEHDATSDSDEERKGSPSPGAGGGAAPAGNQVVAV